MIMVKKRLFLLVLLQVASVLVSCQDDVVEEPGFPVDEQPIVDEPQPIEDEPQPIVEEPQPPMEEFPPEVVPYLPPDIIEDPVVFEEPEDDVVVEEEYETFVRTVTKKRKKTTTFAPLTPCIELSEIIAAKQDCTDNPMEGYTSDQCALSIVDEESCAWVCSCGATITEAPTQPPPEEEEEDSAEGEIEECEPKKKFKFDNCFLKIRGLIKKKKPRRC
jgi:hypothetical protein